VGRLIRLSQEEKMEIIHLVEHSSLPIRQTLEEMDVPRSTFYRWYSKYQEEGYEVLSDRQSNPRQFWNRIPDYVRQQVVDLVLGFPDKSPRQIGWLFVDQMRCFISESSVYRILKSFDLVQSPIFQMVPAKDKYERPTKRVHELWQTDFTQFKVIGGGIISRPPWMITPATFWPGSFLPG